jgi:hypothetical protein
VRGEEGAGDSDARGVGGLPSSKIVAAPFLSIIVSLISENDARAGTYTSYPS